jgi:replication-associated recombination protein RarA
MSLPERIRPKKFDEVIGQSAAVQLLSRMISKKNLPNVVMLIGPTGCGKSTLARIVANQIGGVHMEIDCADTRGIDTVREIKEHLKRRPLNGLPRVWLLEEVIQLPKTTQQALLVTLETADEKYDYFLLCTSDTSGLVPAFVDRCLQIYLNPLSEKDIGLIIDRALYPEEESALDETRHMIARKAGGSGRRALQILESVIPLATKKERMEAIEKFSTEEEAAGEFLGKLLLSKGPWQKITETVMKLLPEDIEKTRIGVLNYAAACMRNLKLAPQCYLIITCFQEPWFNMRTAAKAGLLAACWAVLR